MPIQFRRKDNLKGTEAENRIGEAIREGFESLGNDLVSSLKSRLPVRQGRFSRGVDRGRFKAGIKKRISGKGFKTRMLIFDAVEHAENVEKKRAPGKQPPPDVMLGWVRRKGLGARAFSIKTRRAIAAGTKRTFNRALGKRRTAAQSLLQIQKSIAFLIGRAIAKRGLPGLYLFRDLKTDYASKISLSMTAIKAKISNFLNA